MEDLQVPEILVVFPEAVAEVVNLVEEEVAVQKEEEEEVGVVAEEDDVHSI